MKINLLKFKNDNGENRVEIMFEHHRAVIFTSEISEQEETLLSAKLKVVDEYLNTLDPIYTKKEILKTWAKIDEQMKEYYKKNFDNRGGKREGAGRKVGSYANGIKSNRTEQFTMAITKEEKDFLKQQLLQFRNQHRQI